MISLRKIAIAAGLVASMGAAATTASAQPLPDPVPAFTTAPLNLRTGPSTSYPSQVVMPLHAQVWAFYCIPSPFWCYLNYGPYYGWASARYLESYPGVPQPPIYGQPIYTPQPPVSPYVPPSNTPWGPAAPQSQGGWSYPNQGQGLVPLF